MVTTGADGRVVPVVDDVGVGIANGVVEDGVVADDITGFVADNVVADGVVAGRADTVT